LESVGQPRIVVGVSGSLASAKALRWAAAEAQRRRALLGVVTAWEPEHRASYAPPGPRHSLEQQRLHASQELECALKAAFGPVLPTDMITELAECTAERALVDRSAGADLLVLGSTSSRAGRSIGPVIRACLTSAHCPVLVIGPEGARGELARVGNDYHRAGRVLNDLAAY
jgi:nucleotide-binding universal stress UspA family protein